MKKRTIKMLTAFLTAASVMSTQFISMPVINVEAAAKIAAFPGAEGGGKFATGGRGGEVYYVTNLNDSGTGSFRDAVSKSNRIVLFKVSGTIELKSDVVVQSNVTIAGQSAPGGTGVTLKNYKIGLGGSNIIMRFISSRPGERGKAAEYDALGGANGSNSIVDHCSFGWANDEQWGLYSNNLNATTQWSIIGPSNSFSYHKKGIHGFGVMFGKGNHSMHHNMIVENVSRNFRGKVEGTYTADFVNNVIYNWGYQTAYGTIGHLNYAGNYLKMGPSTAGGYHYISVDSTTKPENFKMYLSDNKMVTKEGTDYGTLCSNNWSGVTYAASTGRNEANMKSNSAFEMIVNGQDVSVAKNAESAESAYKNVLKYAGAGKDAASRTPIDKQVMQEAETGTGYIVGARPYSEADSSQKATIDKYKIQCGTVFKYPSAVTKGAAVDTDGDGMPDEWEKERGLNPNSAKAEDGSLEANGDYCGQGYTNIEYYLNDLTVNAFPEGTVKVSPKVNQSNNTSGDNQDTGTNTNTNTYVDATDIVNNGLYIIQNVNSGLCFDVAGGVAANGTNVQQWGSGSSPASYNTWKMVSAGSGYYYIYSLVGDGNTYALDVTGKKAIDGTNIEIYTKNTSDAQLFKIVKNNDGTYSFLTKVSKNASCVEVADSSKASGGNIQEYTFKGTDNQKFKLTKVTTGTSSNENTGTSTGTSTNTQGTTDSQTTSTNTGSIKVEKYNTSTDSASNTIGIAFNITNTGASTLDLSTVNLRYYYTNENNKTQNCWCDWSTLDASNVISAFYSMPSAKTNADYYLNLSFKSGTTLAAGASATIQLRIANTDWSNFTQSNDYSFDNKSTSYVESTKTPAYINNKLVWGIEP